MLYPVLALCITVNYSKCNPEEFTHPLVLTLPLYKMKILLIIQVLNLFTECLKHYISAIGYKH